MKTESKKKKGRRKKPAKKHETKKGKFFKAKIKKSDLKDGKNLWKENFQQPLRGVKANTQKYSLISTYTCSE